MVIPEAFDVLYSVGRFIAVFFQSCFFFSKTTGGAGLRPSSDQSKLPKIENLHRTLDVLFRFFHAKFFHWKFSSELFLICYSL